MRSKARPKIWKAMHYFKDSTSQWLRPNYMYVRNIPRPVTSVLSVHEWLDPLYNPLPSTHPINNPTNGMKCYACFQRCTIHKMRASEITTVHFKTHVVCPIRTCNFGPIGLSFICYPLIRSKGLSNYEISCMNLKSYCNRKWLRLGHIRYIPRVWPIGIWTFGYIGLISNPMPPLDPINGRPNVWNSMHNFRTYYTWKCQSPNHVRYIPRSIGPVISAHRILDHSVHYPIFAAPLIRSIVRAKVWNAMRELK